MYVLILPGVLEQTNLKLLRVLPTGSFCSQASQSLSGYRPPLQCMEPIMYFNINVKWCSYSKNTQGSPIKAVLEFKNSFSWSLNLAMGQHGASIVTVFSMYMNLRSLPLSLNHN